MHPSVGGEHTHDTDTDRQVRRTDYEFLISAQAQELLRQQDITVIDYRTIQRAWARAR